MVVSTLFPLLSLLAVTQAAPTCRARSSAQDSGIAPPADSPTTSDSSPSPTASLITETVATTTPPASSSAVLAPSPPHTSSGSDGSSGNAEQDLFLSLHNNFRAKYGASPLSWNQELADFAQGVANTCKMVHSGGPYGENLAAGAGGGYDIIKGFNGWANEASLYNWNSPGFQSSTGHFTQVVWKATTELGCAVAKCADGTLFTGYGEGLNVVCEYRAAGNMVGNNGQYFRENVGTLIA